MLGLVSGVIIREALSPFTGRFTGRCELNIKPSDIDRRVSEAFDGLVACARESHILGEIAMQPRGRHERTIEGEFLRLLSEREWPGAALQSQHQEGGYKRDIVAHQDSKMALAVEIKTPFTNHDGINNKTRKKEHLPKDMDSLKAALDAGAVRAYYLVTPIGCYPVDRQGEMIVLDSGNVRKNEEAVNREFQIQWPTRQDYESTGKPEVERAMQAVAGTRLIEARKVKDWVKVELPNPQTGINAFLDCALYRIRLNR